MLMPSDPPRTLGLPAPWLDMPATEKGEPLNCTGCECECWNCGRCSWLPPLCCPDVYELLGNMAGAVNKGGRGLEDERHDDGAAKKDALSGVRTGEHAPRDVIAPIEIRRSRPRFFSHRLSRILEQSPDSLDCNKTGRTAYAAHFLLNTTTITTCNTLTITEHNS